jgi:hypothetical protein
VILPTGAEIPWRGFTPGKVGSFGIDGQYPDMGVKNLQSFGSLGDRIGYVFDSVTRLNYRRYAPVEGWAKVHKEEQYFQHRHIFDYYEGFVVPKGAKRRIVAIVDDVLILDEPVKRAAINVDVWRDNWPEIHAFLAAGTMITQNKYGIGVLASPMTVIVPGDTLVFSDRVEVMIREQLTIQPEGNGKAVFYTPQGCGQMHFSIGTNNTVRRISLRSEQGKDNFSFNWWPNNSGIPVLTNKTPDLFNEFFRGYWVGANCVLEDISVEEHITASIQVHGRGAVVRRALVKRFTGKMHYFSWDVVFASDGSHSVVEDLTLDFPERSTAFEMFGVSHSTFRRVRGRNAAFSINSGSYNVLEDIHLTFDALSTPSWRNSVEPIMTFNQNAYPGLRYGNRVENLTIEIKGPLDKWGNLATGVGIESNQRDFVIKNYRYIAPDWVDKKDPTTGFHVRGPVALEVAGENIFIDGVTTTAVPGMHYQYPWGDPSIMIRRGTTGTIQNVDVLFIKMEGDKSKWKYINNKGKLVE